MKKDENIELRDTCVFELIALDDHERKRLESILMRNKYSHEFPSNINGAYLSVNKVRKKFHRFVKLNHIAKGVVKNDFDEVVTVKNSNDYHSQLLALKIFIES